MKGKDLDLRDLRVGLEVWWEDPDNGISSGIYTVAETNKEEYLSEVKLYDEEFFSEDDIYILLTSDGSESEVFFSELYEVK